jgi:hypothetical protein
MAAVTGFLLAATLVALLQFLRVRDRRLLPLLVLFALGSLARFAGLTSALGLAADLGSSCAGLVLLFMLAPRHLHTGAR